MYCAEIKYKTFKHKDCTILFKFESDTLHGCCKKCDQQEVYERFQLVLHGNEPQGHIDIDLRQLPNFYIGDIGVLH